MALYLKSFVSLIIVVVLLLLPLIIRKCIYSKKSFADEKNKKVFLKQISYIDKKTKIILVEYNNNTSLILIGENFCSVIEKTQGQDEKI